MKAQGTELNPQPGNHPKSCPQREMCSIRGASCPGGTGSGRAEEVTWTRSQAGEAQGADEKLLPGEDTVRADSRALQHERNVSRLT